jgi:K+-sensing histidine kinase KdpD
MTDRFFRSAMHQQIEGAGLGLSIVNQILILNKAKMDIDNTYPGRICICIREEVGHF